jgi:hypothetical protein
MEVPKTAPSRSTVASLAHTLASASSSPRLPAHGNDVNQRTGSKSSPVYSWEDSKKLRQKAGNDGMDEAAHLQTSKTPALIETGGVGRSSPIDAALTAENLALREELDRWRRAGAKVAEREARVAEMLKQASQSRAGIPNVGALEIASQEAQTQNRLPAQSLQLSLQLAIGLAVLALVSLSSLAWCFSSKEIVGPSKANVLARTLRESGLQTYVIEVSELQVWNLAAASEIYMSLHTGGKDFLTKSVESSTGGLLRFSEVITFSMTPSPMTARGSCKLAVVDRNTEERLAYLEIPSQNLLRLVHEDHREYFHFDLVIEAHRLKARLVSSDPSVDGTHVKRPSMAMRIRDVTGLMAADTCVSRPSRPVSTQMLAFPA